MPINSVGRKEDALDKVAKGLSIANGVLGVVGGIQGIRKSSAEMDALEEGQRRIKEGILTPKEQLEYSKDYNASESQTPGSFGLKTPDGKSIYYSPKDKKSDNPGLMTPQAFLELKNKQFTEVPVGTKGADVVSVYGPDGKPTQHALMPPKFSDPAKEPKSDQFKVAQFGQRMQQAENVFSALRDKGYDPTSLGSAVQRVGIFPNMLKDSDVQQQEQAERNFVNAVLRRESGAAISKEEFSSAVKQYFPRAGDSAEVIAQKAANRALAINGFKQEAGDAWKRVGQGMDTPMVAKVGKPSEVMKSATAGGDGTDTRIINGAVYKKTKGGWQRQ